MVTNAKEMDRTTIFFAIVVAVGNGGYYALAQAQNLNEAILANKLTYVIGIFAPMLVFFIICNVCHINLPKWLIATSLAVQIALYLAVCSTGRSEIFYKTIEFNMGANGAFLTKTYGPLHTVYLITLMLYTLAGIVVSLYSLNRKAVVSRTNIYTFLTADSLAVAIYVLERIIHLEVEMMPICFIIVLVIMLIPLKKIYNYSVYLNDRIVEEKFNDSGFIVFNNKMKYMGCNECASTLFPELKEWELEEKIPGNGGRFNTFLRQPLQRFEKEHELTDKVKGSYEYKNQVYHYEISCLLKDKIKSNGYVIQISNVTDIVANQGI